MKYIHTHFDRSEDLFKIFTLIGDIFGGEGFLLDAARGTLFLRIKKHQRIFQAFQKDVVENDRIDREAVIAKGHQIQPAVGA